MSVSDITQPLANDEPRHVYLFNMRNRGDRLYAGFITLPQAWAFLASINRHGIITGQDNVQTHIDYR